MIIGVIGSGGREHAICVKILESKTAIGKPKKTKEEKPKKIEEEPKLEYAGSVEKKKPKKKKAKKKKS